MQNAARDHEEQENIEGRVKRWRRTPMQMSSRPERGDAKVLAARGRLRNPWRGLEEKYGSSARLSATRTAECSRLFYSQFMVS